jgi:CRP-like cAMP-binding protein
MNPSLVTSIPLFSGIARRHHGEVAALADVVDVPAGAVLTREGELAREAFVVIDGSADVHVGGVRVSTVGRGSLVGELGLVAGSRRTATVGARSAMQLLVMGPRELASLMHRFPSVRERVGAAASVHLSGGAT